MGGWDIALVVLALLIIPVVTAKIYDRCELAAILEKAGFGVYRGYTIGDWLCLVHYESGFDTSFVDHNPDGSSNYGIFQINSAWWCDNGITPTPNLCNMDCRDLLNRHVLDDIMCARKVVGSRKGMKAWDAWIRHCSGHDLSSWTKGCTMHAKPYKKKINS
ncbi:sperm acrosome-associated protein 5-like [Erinaceus europaeus]|uniref:Sperm acrosome-associated protein 5-like n=1 Tax=Erinaceus europaeus TaxID=9365 RepID=A0A1S3A548_ERIEU|nr:sperm acrosome-associated protein 5-like [Erinaceus europaeus]